MFFYIPPPPPPPRPVACLRSRGSLYVIDAIVGAVTINIDGEKFLVGDKISEQQAQALTKQYIVSVVR